jgi:hypothetical protein
MSEKYIESLTEEQEAQIPVYRDKWIKIGRNVGPVDRERAEKAVDLAYKCANQTPPEQKIWALSPQAGAEMAARIFADKGENYSPTKNEIRNQLNEAGYGSHDASWISFLDYFDQVCGLDLKELEGLRELSQCCGWWWPFHKVVILTELPREIHIDNENRLHHESRMAISYPDGFGVYVWHGIRVPERLILDPDSYTAEEIINESNAEVRRCMTEKLGLEKLLEVATKIHRDKFGTLYEIELQGDENIKFVQVVNSTPEKDGRRKEYQLRVPTNIKTAHEAVAWTFDTTPEEYNPTFES